MLYNNLDMLNTLQRTKTRIPEPETRDPRPETRNQIINGKITAVKTARPEINQKKETEYLRSAPNPKP